MSIDMRDQVIVTPKHVIREHSVHIVLTTDNPLELCYHQISPERALALLAELQQAQATIEQMASVNEHDWHERNA